MKTKIFVVALVLGLIGLSSAYYFFTKKVPGLENVDADFELTADELFDAFDQDEAKAALKYEGKVIRVTGKVARHKHSDSTSNVTLHAENAMVGGINCFFNELVPEINKGETLTVKGRCQGFLMDVLLNNCTKK